MHMDHFIGFDTLLRVSIGREKRIRILGPEGLCERLHHKLQGYEWDLAHRYEADLVIEATELDAEAAIRSATFRFKRRFAWEEMEPKPPECGGLTLFWALLEHHGPCLGFAVAERAHANVWRNRLGERSLPVGPWLQKLKQAVLAGSPDDEPVELPGGSALPLGELRDLVSVSRGQKIAYVTDVADTPANRAAIAQLAQEADTFFIESRFAAEHHDQARERAHLTTSAAGQIARAARVRRVEPFHFSPRYDDQEQRMLDEVLAAFEA
jgi:ribonuclease Z